VWAAVFPLLIFIASLLAACSQPISVSTNQAPLRFTIQADGENQAFSTSTATTVREVLAEAGIEINDADEVTPPLFTPLEQSDDLLAITVIRITESIEVIPRSLPFERKLVRNEAMDADETPRIIQAGHDGLQEETIRIVYRDGLEAERWVTQVTIIEPAQDEIVMVGIGAAQGNVSFGGTLAYISGGNPVLLRGLSAFPEPLNTGEGLDGRVFSLSPDGSHLLFTRITTNTTSFNNSLWVISTTRGARPWSLQIDNVLWADWEPGSTNTPRIAFTTAKSTNLPPGWEANNDLWIGDVSSDRDEPFDPEQLVEAYPATYGWWGGNYAWSPEGRILAYSFANEVGVIDTETEEVSGQRRQLQQFTEYNTRSDWVWVPSLTWSPDGRFLAFTNHSSSDPEELAFASWVVDVETGRDGRIVDESGMWAHMHWTPTLSARDGQIAFLKATDPLDSQRSSYTLWMVDQDGSNGRRLYPPAGELSFFPREQTFMAWGPDGRQIAFIFDDGLYLLDLDEVNSEGTPIARLISQENAAASHPTWSITNPIRDEEPTDTPEDDLPIPLRGGSSQFLPDE
jgi:Tol biopolymer transport system component